MSFLTEKCPLNPNNKYKKRPFERRGYLSCGSTAPHLKRHKVVASPEHQFPKKQYLPSKDKRSVMFLDELPPNCGTMKRVMSFKSCACTKEIKSRVALRQRFEASASKGFQEICQHKLKNVGNKWSQSSVRPNLAKHRDAVVYKAVPFGEAINFCLQDKRAISCDTNEVAFGSKWQECDIIDVENYESFMSRKPHQSRAVGQDANTEGAHDCIGKKDRTEHAHDADKSTDLHTATSNEEQAVFSRMQVKETLRLFREMYIKLLDQHNIKGLAKTKRQIHLEAANYLKEQGKWVNTAEKFLGQHVPGVEVGDEFQFRVELAIVGLHGQVISGIDYVRKEQEVLAISIVDSERYLKQIDSSLKQVAATKSSDVLIYSGHGGNPEVGCAEPRDQILERGNLALCNSMHAKTPVRVTCKQKRFDARGSSLDGRTSTYIYQGLYVVEDFFQERGTNGKLVFMFVLRRIPGQPRLARKIVSQARKLEIRRKEKVVVNDVSQGKEMHPIRALSADNEKPPVFNYATEVIYPEWFLPSMARCCACTDGCSNSVLCSCRTKTKCEILLSGKSNKSKSFVYECGQFCKCDINNCTNKSTQCGSRYQLELFKKESGGWGVRTRGFISSGKFVCEFVGQLIPKKDAKRVTSTNEYIFYTGNQMGEDHGGSFVVDASKYGNIARFINHSCAPNLYAQYVLYDHDDKRMPHIMLFAAKDIPPSKELTLMFSNKEVCDFNNANKYLKDAMIHHCFILHW